MNTFPSIEESSTQPAWYILKKVYLYLYIIMCKTNKQYVMNSLALLNEHLVCSVSLPIIVVKWVQGYTLVVLCAFSSQYVRQRQKYFLLPRSALALPAPVDKYIKARIRLSVRLVLLIFLLIKISYFIILKGTFLSVTLYFIGVW